MKTRKELLRLLAAFSLKVRTKGRGDLSRALQRMKAKDAPTAIATLEEVAGRTSATSSRALRTVPTSGVLPGPPQSLVRKLGGAAAAAGYERPFASALLKGVRQGLGKIVAAIGQKARYRSLFARLGNPTEGEWAAMLQRAIMWTPHAGDQLEGQVATLSGFLLERIRRSTTAFRSGGQAALKIVAEHNAQLLGGLKGTAAELEARIAKALEAGHKKLFRDPAFFENMTDGDGKLLSDGMHLSFNDDGEVLISRLEEVKLESVAGDALPQLDEDFVRLKTRGMILADGRYFPPGKIRFPRRGVQLSAFIEEATSRAAKTPGGLSVAVEGVKADHLRELARELLLEWRKRLPQLAR
jgi:hypothetical protein